MDAPKAIAHAARSLGATGFALVVMTLALAGGGYLLLSGGAADHAKLAEELAGMREEIHLARQANEQRWSEQTAFQVAHMQGLERIAHLLTALCFSAANGDRDSVMICERAVVSQ